MVKSRSDSITRQFNNSPQAESRTVPRQESRPYLRFAKVANLFLSLPLASLLRFRVPLSPFTLRPMRRGVCRNLRRDLPFCTGSAWLLKQTCVKKFISPYSLNSHFKPSKNKKLNDGIILLYFNLLLLLLFFFFYMLFSDKYANKLSTQFNSIQLNSSLISTTD